MLRPQGAHYNGNNGSQYEEHDYKEDHTQDWGDKSMNQQLTPAS